MIDHAAFKVWLDAYIQAWKTYQPDDIRALFAENATYSYNPFDAEPVSGREAIVQNWLDYRDAPGSFDAHYAPVAVDGDTAVANGRTRYFDADGKTVLREYDNIFVIRFDDQGRCVEFKEWFMMPRKTTA